MNWDQPKVICSCQSGLKIKHDTINGRYIPTAVDFPKMFPGFPSHFFCQTLMQRLCNSILFSASMLANYQYSQLSKYAAVIFFPQQVYIYVNTRQNLCSAMYACQAYNYCKIVGVVCMFKCSCGYPHGLM